MKTEIIVGPQMIPREDPNKSCSCSENPVNLRYKSGIISWLVEEGDSVSRGQVLCEGEIEKKVLEFLAPCQGILLKIFIEEGDEFTGGDCLGVIECR